MAVLTNSTSDTLLSGTSDADSIYNSGNYVTIRPGRGNDTITFASNIDTTSPDIHAAVDLDAETISAVTIGSRTSPSDIFVKTNDEILTFHHESVDNRDYSVELLSTHESFSGGLGWLYSPNTDVWHVSAGVQHDFNASVSYDHWTFHISDDTNALYFLTTQGWYHTIFGSARNDSIHYESYASIFGGAGDDYIGWNGMNGCDGLTIDGGAGNDYIEGGLNSVIDGGDGDDTLEGGASTIRGGRGNDLINITGYADLILYASGDGDDTVRHSDGDDTLQITDGSTYSTAVSGNDLLVNVNSGSIRFVDAATLNVNIISAPINVNASNAQITVGASNVVEYSDGDGNVMIYGLSSNTTINLLSGSIDGAFSDASNVTLKIGSGALVINNAVDTPINVLNPNGALSNLNFEAYHFENALDNQTFRGTYNSDGFFNYGNSVSLDAGADDDWIENYGRNVTINAGTGNDDVYNWGFEVYIDAGSNEDVIVNWGSGTSIEAGTGNDTINNCSDHSTVRGGDGNDSIFNTYRWVNEDGTSGSLASAVGYVDGGAGSDTIENYSSSVTIDGGTDDDMIWNEGSFVSIVGGAGNDSINNTGASVTIDGGAGQNTIENTGASASIVGGAYRDDINNRGAKTFINAGASDDVIKNSGAQSTLDGGVGADSINNTGASVSLVGGAGSDTIENHGSSVTIDGGADDDTILNIDAAFVSIVGGAGNDSIDNYDGERVTINGGAGDDELISSGIKSIIIGVSGRNKIRNYGADSTVQGGVHDDYIFNGHTTVNSDNHTSDATRSIVDGGEGSDTIVNNSANATLNGSAGNDFLENAEGGTNSVLDGGDGVDTLHNYAAGSTLKGGAGNDTIYNAASNAYLEGGDGNDNIFSANNDQSGAQVQGVTISAGAGNDTISSGQRALIKGGAGDDSIYAQGYSTIDGGDGADTIFSEGYSTLDGGAGNDQLNIGENDTVRGGKGNDTINLALSRGANVVQYSSGDGDDVIVGFRADTTLQLLDGTINSYTLGSGRDSVDVILKVGTGSITIKQYAGNQIYVVDANGNSLSNDWYGPSKITNAASNYVKGTAYNDEIRTYVDGSTIEGGDGNDVLENRGSSDLGGASVSIAGGAGNDLLYNYAGDRVTLDGGAGDDQLYNYARDGGVTLDGGRRFYLNGGDGNDRLENETNELTTLVGGAGNDTISNLGPLASIDGGAGADSIENYGFVSTILGGAGRDTIINRAIESDKSPSGAIIGSGSVIDAGADDDYIENQSGVDDVSLDGGAGNDTIKNSGGRATVLGGTGNDSIVNESSGTMSAIDGGAGADRIVNRASDVSIIAGDGSDSITNSGSHVTIRAGVGSDTIDLGTDSDNQIVTDSSVQSYSVEGEDIVLKTSGGSIKVLGMNGKQMTVNGVKKYYGAINITNTQSSVTIASDEYNDQITNQASDVAINSGAGDDSLYNNYSGNRVTLEGGAGNDLISNEGEYVSIDGGAGNDIINNGGEYVSIDGGAGDDSLYNSYSGDRVTLEGGAGNDIISNDGEYVSIDGGAGNDYIYTSGVEVTVGGGSGNDTIAFNGYNDNKENVLQYSGGNDVVVDFNSENSTLRLLNDTLDPTNYTVDGSDLVLNVGSGSIRFVDRASMLLNVVDKNGKTTSKYFGPVNISVGENTVVSTDQYNDVIRGGWRASNTTIRSGAGDDSITYDSESSNVLIDAGEGNDTIHNAAEYSTINAGAGEDSIKNGIAFVNDALLGGDHMIINAGAGNDTVQNYGSRVTINGDAGADRIINDGSASLSALNGGDGNDTIENSAASVTLNGGGGDDSLYNNYTGVNVSIDGGAGNDYIHAFGDSLTVGGGAGNDTLRFYEYASPNNVVQYSSGNDVFVEFNGENSTLRLLNDTLDPNNYSVDGNDVVLNVGSGSIRLVERNGLLLNIVDKNGKMTSRRFGAIDIRNYDSNTVITSDQYDDRVYNNGTNVTIDVGAGNDTIKNQGASVSIDGGDGNDSIYNYNGAHSTIDGGVGDDTIENQGASVSIDGGDGNDYVSNWGDSVTINGGLGSDTISNGGTHARAMIVGGAGNDSIYNSANQVTIDSGIGDDTIENNGATVLIDAGSGNDRIRLNDSASSVTINAGDGNDSIYNTGWLVTVSGGAGDDTINRAELYRYSSGNDVITEYRFTTDAIDQINAAVSSHSIDGSDVVFKTSNGSIRVKNRSGKMINVNGYSRYYGPVNLLNTTRDVRIRTEEYNDTIAIVAQNVTVDPGSGDDVISISSGIHSIGNVIIAYGLVSYAVENDDVVLKKQSGSIRVRGANGKLLNVNGTEKFYGAVDLTSTLNNTLISTDGYNDRIVTSGSNVTINAGGGSDTISLGSGAGNVIVAASLNGYSIDGSDVVLKNGSGSIRVLGMSSKQLNVNGKTQYYGSAVISNGYGNSNTLIATAPEAYNDNVTNYSERVTIQTFDGSDMIFNRANNVSIDAGAGDDTIFSDTEYNNVNNQNVTINAGAGNDLIKSEGDNALIFGGAGNDSINVIGSSVTVDAGAGNDTLNRADIYKYSSGDDVITDYKVGDRIDASVSSYSISGSDVVFRTSNGSIRLKNASGSKINVNGTSRYYGPVSLSNSTANTLVGTEEYNDTITNTASGVTINAGAGNDQIINSGTNVTVIDAAGNDTLNRADVYKYSSGDDVITDYKAGDTIQAAVTSYVVSNADALLRTSNGSILLSNGAGKRIDLVDGGKLTAIAVGNAVVSNTNDSIVVTTSSGNDHITNQATNATIQSGAGADTIENTYNAVLIGNGNYSLAARGANAWIDTGDDNDVITNYGEGATILAGSGNDSIYNQSTTAWLTNTSGEAVNGKKAIVDAGAGNDYVENTADSVSINAGLGNDLISNSGSNVTVNGGSGDDTINRANVYQYSAGNDVITEYAEGDTIKLLNNTPTSYSIDGSDVMFKVGSGSIRVKNKLGQNITIVDANGTKTSRPYGSMTIDNSKANTLLSSFDANDSIKNVAASVTIRSAEGNDTINNTYLAKLISGTRYSIQAISNNSVLDAGVGNDLITNYGESTTINAGDGNDTINNKIESLAISNTASTLLGGKKAIINAGAGDDLVDNEADNVTIQGGDGKDRIKNSGASVSINAGADNDSISNDGVNATIAGGSGNDTISNTADGVVFLFGAADGLDVINGFNKNDTLRISDGAINSMYSSNGNYIVNVKGTKNSGSVTLKGMGSNTFKVDGRNIMIDPDPVSIINNARSNTLISGTNGSDSITNSGKGVTVQSNGGNDTINSSANAELFIFKADGGSNIIKNFSDGDTVSITGGSIKSHYADDGDYVIELSSGSIVLEDVAKKQFKVSGALLTVAEAGYFIDNDRDSTLISGTSKGEHISNTGSNVTIQPNGGNDTITGADESGDLFVFGYDDGSNVITNFGKGDTLKNNTSKATMTFTQNDNDAIVTIANGSKKSYVTLQGAGKGKYVLKQSNNMITVDPGVNVITNSKDKKKVSGTSGIDYIYNYGSNVTIAGSKGNDTVEGCDYGELFTFAYNHGKNVITNFGGNDTLMNLTDGATMSVKKSNEDAIVTIKKGSSSSVITLLGAGAYDFVPSSDGNVFTVDTVNVIENDEDRTLIAGTDERDFIINNGAKVTIQPGKGNDTIEGSTNGELFRFSYNTGSNVITNFGKNDTLMSSYSKAKLTFTQTDDDAIVTIASGNNKSYVTLQGAGKNKYVLKQSGVYLTVENINVIDNDRNGTVVSGSNGNDYIYNDGANVTIKPGKGNDTIEGSDNGEVFVFAQNSGNNVITNFGKNDTIVASSSTIQSVKVSGNNAIVTIKGASSSSVVTLLGAGDYNFVQATKKLTVDYINTIDNDSVKAKIVGTDGKDWIINSASKVTIQPGKGNDTIDSDESNAEMFLFDQNSGKNLIMNFGKNDTLRTTASSSSITGVKSANGNAIVTIKGASSSAIVTLEGAGDYKFIQTKRQLTVDPINYIENSRNKTLVSGSTSKDSIVNTGSNVTIQSGKGDDTITGAEDVGDVYKFAYNYGSNVITNFGKEDTLYISSGSLGSSVVSKKDVVFNITSASSSTSATVTLKGAADYKFKKSGRYITVDYIPTLDNAGNNTVISGSDKTEYIFNTGSNVTIKPNKGNDTITGSDTAGDVFVFAYNSGANVITNFGKGDSLRNITSGATMSVKKSKENAIVTLTKNTTSSVVTLLGAGDYDFIQTKNSLLTVDYVNTIESSKDGKKLTGTSERDLILNTNAKQTITPGRGNDTIYASDYAELFQFATTSDQNLIKNFGKSDTLKMTTSKATMTVDQTKNDAVVTIAKGANKSLVTLEGAGTDHYVLKQSGSYLTVDNVNVIVNTADSKKVTGSSGRDYIYNSGEHVTITGNKGNDTIEGATFGEVFTFAATHGNNVITNFGSNDTIYISSGSIQSRVKVGDDYVINIKNSSNAAGSITLQGAGSLPFIQSGRYLTVDKINYIDNDRDSTVVTGSSGKDYITNTGANVTIRPNGGNDTIEGASYGERFLFGTTHGKNVITNFGKNDTLQNITSGATMTIKKSGANHIVTITKGSNSSTITLENTSDYKFIQSGKYLTVENINEIINDRDDTLLAGTNGNDYIINNGEHVTIQSKSGNDTIDGADYGEVFSFAYNHGKNVVTNFGLNDTLRCSSGSIKSYKKSGDNMIVTLSSTSSSTTSTITLQGAGSYEFTKSGRNLFVKGISEKVNHDNRTKFNGTSADDYMINTGARVTINGGAGDDTIVGSDEYGEVITFAYNHGNDVVMNFVTNDTLKITSGTIKSYAADGNDYLIEINNSKTTGTIRLKDAVTVGTLSKTNSTTLRLTAKSSSAQMPSEDYWFTPMDEASLDDESLSVSPSAEDPLDEILSLEDKTIVLPDDPIVEIKPVEIDQISSARSTREKK